MKGFLVAATALSSASKGSIVPHVFEFQSVKLILHQVSSMLITGIRPNILINYALRNLSNFAFLSVKLYTSCLVLLHLFILSLFAQN